MSEVLKEGYYHFITIESSEDILDKFCKQWNEHLEYCGSSLRSGAKPFKLLEISTLVGRVIIDGVKRVSVTCVVLSTFSQDDNFNDFIENSITVPYNAVRLLSSFILLVPASQASITDAADWGSVAEIVTKSMQEVAGGIVSTNDSMTDVKTVNDLEERPYQTVKNFTDTSTIHDGLKGITDNYLKVLENYFRSVVGDAYKILHQIYNCSGHPEHVVEAEEITLTIRKDKDITIILTQEGHSEKSVFDISTLIIRE